MAMDMMTGDQIAQAELADWRKLAQGLHARYITDGLGKAASFVQALSEASGMDRHLRVRIGPGYVDLELVSEDAIYCDDEGTKHTVEWVTAHDVELARHITGIAAEQGLRADPTAVSELELGLDTLAAAHIAPVWAALLTGDANSRGRGTPSEEIRDATVRVPNLWFNEVPQHDGSQRFHVEIYVAAEAVEQRLAAVVAAGGTVVDDSGSPGLTVIADPAGNRGILCATVPPAASDEAAGTGE